MSKNLEDHGSVSLEEESKCKDEIELEKSVDPPLIKQDVSNLSTSDICRICHMGGFPVLPIESTLWEWPKQNAPRTTSQTSTLSSYAYLGPLISVCKCRGTVALVHSECLERWLTESGNTRCELCGYKYLTIKVPRHGLFRSVWIWFNTVVATRQMVFDMLYLLVTTPLALFSIYICALALKMILNTGFTEIPWMIVAMLPTCALTFAAYWSWLITLGRYINRIHGRRWRRFWRNQYVIRILPENPSDRSEEEIISGNNSHDHEDFQDLFQLHY